MESHSGTMKWLLFMCMKKPVDIDDLVLQKEEVDEVKWFDINEVREGCLHRDGTFCVPMEGLETLMKYLGDNQ